MSGSGAVSKEITDENILEAWRDVLKKWHANLTQRPKQVHGGLELQAPYLAYLQSKLPHPKWHKFMLNYVEEARK